MTPDDYCADKTGYPGSDLYYSLLFLPTPPRRAVNAVFAFVRETGEIGDDTREPDVARAKLDWWRDETARLFSGAPRHPVTRALAPAIAAYGFTREPFLALLDAAAQNLGPVRIETFDQLRAHCRQLGAIPQLLAADVFGAQAPATREYAATLGVALRLTEIVSDIGHDLRHERLFLPAADLRRHGVTEADLLARRHTPAFEALMAHATQQALDLFDQALALLPPADYPKQLPGRILAELARAQLEEIRRDGYRVLERKLALTPLRKLWIAYRTRLSNAGRGRHAA